MGDTTLKYKVAAVHASPVYLNREETTAKACRLIAEAAGEGARLIVFPESFLPGYPYWVWTHTPREGNPPYCQLMLNAVDVPSETTDILCEAAKKAGIYVVMGMTEREGGTLYNTLLYIDDSGKILGKHRKLQPTMGERIIWGRGDGVDLEVFDTPLGKISGLICWEHMIDLARVALAAQGEQIHISAWPGISAVTNDPNYEIFNDVADCATRHHAVSTQTFVISVFSPIDQDTIDKLGLTDRPEMIMKGGGHTAIIGPNGQYIAGPITGETEQILYGELDFLDIIRCKYACDCIGHYARPDILCLQVDKSKPVVAEVFGDDFDDDDDEDDEWD